MNATATKSTPDQFDAFVAASIKAHTATIRAQLIAGDDDTIATIDDALGAMLTTQKKWAALIQAQARGEDKFAALMAEAIHDYAEILALKDAERAERDRAEDRVQQKVGLREWDRAMA